MEFVFVVKREAAAPLFTEKGMNPVTAKSLEPVLNGGFFLERPHAEGDSSFKQIIPYVLIKRGHEIFLFKRLKGGGEARLHNLYSVGVGGHINPEEASGDVRGYGLVTGGARRELEEEVGYTGEGFLRPVGLLNDDTNEVGSVHLGVVFVMELPLAIDLTSTEEDVLTGEFVAFHEAVTLTKSETFETWSEIVLTAASVTEAWNA